MNKEKLTIIIVSAAGIFILLIAALFLNSYFSAKKNAPAPNKITPTAETSSQNKATSTSPITPVADAGNRDKLKELIKKEIEGAKSTSPQTVADIYKSVNDCAALNNEADINICVTLWAEYAKDPGLCLKASADGQPGCQNRSYITKAIADKNVSLCVNAIGADAKRTCVFQVVDAAGLSEKDCAALPIEEGKLCLTEVFIAKATSVEDCNNITDASIKEFCRNNFYANLP